MERYIFREGYWPPKGLKPETVVNELERIHDANNGLVASDVIKASRPKKAPLHSVFEWEDDKAAHQYRLNQARALVRSVRIVYEDKADDDHPVYIHVPSEHGGGEREGVYVRPEFLQENHDAMALAWSEAKHKMDGAAKALRDLRRLIKGDDGPYLDKMIEDIDASRDALKGMRPDDDRPSP